MKSQEYTTVGWKTEIQIRPLHANYDWPRFVKVNFIKWFFSAFLIILMAGMVSAGNIPDYKGTRIIEMVSQDVTDSSKIDSTYSIGVVQDADVMDISVILSGPLTIYAGAGNIDTAKIILYSYSNRQSTTHKTTYCGSIPCTLLYAIVGELADSTLLPKLKVDIHIEDSLSDTAGVEMPYLLQWEVLLK